MTLPKDFRNANLNLALAILLRESGAQACNNAWFTITKPAFTEILPTTWKALTDYGFVHRDHAVLYRFTGKGWLEAMRTADQITDGLRADVGRIMSSLKEHVDGRQQTGLASFFAIAKSAGVSTDLLFNIVESRFIEAVFHRRGPVWHKGSIGKIISVPIDFGYPL